MEYSETLIRKSKRRAPYTRADISRVSTCIMMKPRSVHPMRNPICGRRIMISSMRHALERGQFNAVPSHTSHPICTGSESLVSANARVFQPKFWAKY